jgi:hypothetical protein
VYKQKILARHDCTIVRTKLTQIHTYRGGIFEGTNYRTTHFPPMSCQPFSTGCRRGNDNTRPPGVKEEKYRSPDTDKIRRHSFRHFRQRDRTEKRLILRVAAFIAGFAASGA